MKRIYYHSHLKQLALLFLLSNSNYCYASNLYVKIELPTIDSNTNLGSNKSSEYENVTMVNSNIIGRYGIGIGYKLSDYFEVEILHSQLEYNAYDFVNQKIETYVGESTDHEWFSPAFPEIYEEGRKINLCLSYKPKLLLSKKDVCERNSHNHEWFGPAFPEQYREGRRTILAACYRLHLLLSRKDICGDTKIDYKKSLKSNNANTLNTSIATFKIKPYGQVGAFTPYISAGLGLAFNNHKYVEYNLDNASISPKVHSKVTNDLGIEFGFGTKIELAERIQLDVSAKYFNYGNHSLIDNKPINVKGYKFSIGMNVNI